MKQIAIVNPLKGTLSHYADELRQTLEGAFASCEVAITSVAEPSTGSSSRIAWLRNYLAALWEKRKLPSGSLVIVTWPVLGFLDIVILRALVGRAAALVIHDGSPMVRATGYGLLSRTLIAALRPSVLVLVHTELARADISSAFLRKTAVLAPHPIAQVVPGQQSTPRSSPLRVLGQYKKDRDVDLIQALARAGVEIEVVGKGWPQIEGVHVDSRFVDEDELVRLLRSSRAILVPYTRFYQSGIAVRAIEYGTPVVCTSHEFMSILAPDRAWFVAPGSDLETWIRGIDAAVEDAGAQTLAVRQRYFEYCAHAWGSVLSTSREA